MPAKFVNVDRRSPMLLPPDLKDWVGDNDLVHFILDVTDTMDTSKAHVNHSGSGNAQYPPRMMLALLIYCYATKCFSSRQIERATYDSIAVRFICASHHPDHDTIAAFRRRNKGLIKECFFYVLSLAREMGILRMGTLSVDGTKLKANAASQGKKTLDALESEIKELKAQIDGLIIHAEEVDKADQDGQGTLLPKELTSKQNRISKLQKAKDVLNERLKTLKSNAEKTAKRYTLPEKDRKRPGKKPNSETAKKRAQKEREKQKVSVTDPTSRSMPHRKEQHIQGYNAQAGVCTKSRLIVSNYISNEPNDTQQLSPILEKLCPEEQSSLRHILADTGYWDGLALPRFESQYNSRIICPPKSPTKKLTKKYPLHHPRKQADEFKRKMLKRLRTQQGKALYKRRAPVSEGVFHVIKNLMGFKEFRLRGIEKVDTEWDLICLASNCAQILRKQGV